MSDHLLIANIIGYAGVAIVLIYYFLMQAKKISIDGLSFSLMNFIASFLILYSLYFHPNWPSIVIEVAWCSISLYGVVNFFRRSKVAV
jgi:paired small multidrug resistance pump